MSIIKKVGKEEREVKKFMQTEVVFTQWLSNMLLLAVTATRAAAPSTLAFKTITDSTSIVSPPVLPLNDTTRAVTTMNVEMTLYIYIYIYIYGGVYTKCQKTIEVKRKAARRLLKIFIVKMCRKGKQEKKRKNERCK